MTSFVNSYRLSILLSYPKNPTKSKSRAPATEQGLGCVRWEGLHPTAHFAGLGHCYLLPATC